MSPAAGQLVGRDEELGAIVRILDAREQLPGVIALSGEAGIGKTALWSAGIDWAAAHGYRVLSARPSEAETQFSFAGLTDLIGACADDALAELPPVQRRALEAALLLAESEAHPDDRAVASAFLGALRLLARDGPLCLAVDDVQWLDAPSLVTLRFAIARLDREPIATLVTVRGDVPPWFRRALPDGRSETVGVEGLSLGAIHEVLYARLHQPLPRPTLIRIWETSRGNPLFALELAIALERSGGALTPSEELPIPSDLDVLLQERIDGLGADAVEVARVAATVADPTAALIATVVGRHFEAGLAEALDAGVLELDGEHLRFVHPLFGSAVASRQTPALRRPLHARLAEIVPSAEERARHLALATAEPDPEAAIILEEAARAARARGAPAAAAELAEQALRLTPGSMPDDAFRRLLETARMHSVAGDTSRATNLLYDARATTAPGNERATLLTELAVIQPNPGVAIALNREALAEVDGDIALEAVIQLRLAELMRWDEGIERGLEHGELAVRCATDVGDPVLRCRALASYGLQYFSAGRGIPREMEEALAIERSLPEWPLKDGATRIHAWQLCFADDLEPARRLVDEVRGVVAARNDAESEATALLQLGYLEWRAGNWEQAERYTADAVELFTQLGLMIAPIEFPGAAVAAHRGRIAFARAIVQRSVASAEADGIGVAAAGHVWVAGFIELSTGNAAAALPHLRRSYVLSDTFMLEPAQRLELGDLLEALIAVGELDDADEVITLWDERARRLDRAWALAILARSRGLLVAAQGDYEAAFPYFERALAEHARSTDPFQHARTLLALGRTQRRAKRRGDARTTLEAALAAFERLGAPLWAEHARAELARIGGRSAPTGELTEAERRIATLVAQGGTNREVAATLFLTVHSVETALTRIYRKLDVRSRSELAHLLAAKT